MADLAGFGSFGGGLASGFMNTYSGLKRIKREDEEEKRQAEIHAHNKKLYPAQEKEAGLRVKAAERADQQADIRQRIQDIAVQVQSGAIDEAEGLRRLASVHGAHPDGKQAFITNVNGRPFAVLGDENTRDSTLHPITGDGSTFLKAYQGLLSVLDPNYGQKQQELGIRSRDAASNETRAGAAVTTANAAARNADTNAQLRKAHEGVYGAMADYYTAGAKGTRVGQEQIVNFTDNQGNIHPYSFNRMDRSFAPLQLPAGMRLPTQRAQFSSLGNTGDITDGTRVLHWDEAAKRYVDATPGASIIDRLRNSAGAPSDGRPSITVPSPDFHRASVGLNGIQRFLGLNARPDVTVGQGAMYRDPLTGEGIDAATWRRKYGEDPPQ